MGGAVASVASNRCNKCVLYLCLVSMSCIYVLYQGMPSGIP
jgi:hypothetical protein